MKGKASKEKRSDCPVNFAVETLGDKWSLVILRDIIFWGKRSYSEFLKSDEKIATNILAGRLEYLESEGLVEKVAHDTDKRKEVYNVTELGLGLVPVFLEMIAWSAKYEAWQCLDHRHSTKEQIRFVERTVNTKNKAKLVEDIKEIVRQGGCVFEGVVPPDPAAIAGN
jgi:DNA-binding HxlR family transcriptional regulator